MPKLLQSRALRTWTGRLIPFVFYVLLLAFLVVYLKSVDFSKLAHLHVSWAYIGLACVLALLNRYVGTYTWVTILRSLGARDIRINRQLIYVYAKAWMGRYIPGTAPWILGKIYFASKQGISKQKLAVSSLLEGGLQIVTLLVFSLALLLFDKRLDVLGDGFKVLMVLVAVTGIVILAPSIFNRLITTAYKLLRHKTIDAEHLATRQTIIRGASLYLVDAAIGGVSLFFIAKGIDPALSYSNVVFATGAASLAGAASMLAIFAPSGLGVREGIQLVLFSLIMPRDLAFAVTIATRLWTVGIDVVFFAISRALVGQPKPEESST